MNMETTNTQWFTDAKYGLFVHFGLYSLLGGVYRGQVAPNTAEWIMRNMQIPLAEYRTLMQSFDPTELDARDYVRRAKEWGMKYVVVTAKHHDGFALFDSKVSSYNVMHTPYGRDIIRDFANACREEGMVFCVYYSQMQDWEHPHGNGNTWDFDPKSQDFRTYFYEKCVPQVKELLENYGDIGLIWFDTPYDMPIELCRELRDTVKACQPRCLINGRIGYGLGDYRQMADNSIPHNTYFRPWEVPMTLNHSWGYSSVDQNWATGSRIVERLSLIASKGGNLLLNVGPTPEGRIPAPCIAALDEAGAWLRAHGESILGTKAILSFPYDIAWGNVTYHPEKHRLYLHIKDYSPASPRVFLIGIENKILAASLVKDGTPLEFIQTYEQARDERRLRVYLPSKKPDPTETVVALDIEGEPRIQTLQ